MTRGRHALTRMVRALTVVVITTGAVTACGPAEQPPSRTYKQEIRACDGLPDVADRTTCWVDALRREQARRHGRTTP